MSHGGGNAAFGHDRVSLAKERFADDADRNALSQRFDGRAQASATRADHEHIVFVGFERRVQNSLTSRMAPEAISRT